MGGGHNKGTAVVSAVFLEVDDELVGKNVWCGLQNVMHFLSISWMCRSALWQ